MIELFLLAFRMAVLVERLELKCKIQMGRVNGTMTTKYRNYNTNTNADNSFVLLLQLEENRMAHGSDGLWTNPWQRRYPRTPWDSADRQIESIV